MNMIESISPSLAAKPHLGSAFSSWEPSLQKPLITGGPCLLESLELGRQVAVFLKNLCTNLNLNFVFKSSFDKANRTSAQSARGPGLEQGIEWLLQLKHELNLAILTDVHTPDQAQSAAAVADIIQIPAFLCEQRDLIKAAAITGKWVQIKRGQHTSPEQLLDVSSRAKDWGGHNRILLCERGTSFGYQNLIVDFRALALWLEAGEKVVFDATHATQLPGAAQGTSGGIRRMALPLARAACGVGVHGLFLEVHPQPERALSDAGTQLNFSMAETLIRQVLPISRAAHGAWDPDGPPPGRGAMI